MKVINCVILQCHYSEPDSEDVQQCGPKGFAEKSIAVLNCVGQPQPATVTSIERKSTPQGN